MRGMHVDICISVCVAGNIYISAVQVVFALCASNGVARTEDGPAAASAAADGVPPGGCELS